MIKFDKRNINTWSIIGTRATFGLSMFELAKNIENLMVITGDVSTSAGLDRYRKTFKEKYLDVGIAEQNLIGVAAGFASEGYNVFTTTFAPFQTMRCLEQIKVNLGYMGLPVKMVGLASGVVLGTLGFTHCCIEDLAITRAIPGLVVMSPADSTETVKCMLAASKIDKPVYIRLTGGSNTKKIYEDDYDFQIGKPIEISKGKDVVIFATGQILSNVLEAKKILSEKNIYPQIINVHTLKPLCEETIIKFITNKKLIITVEEHNVIGGLGSAISHINSSLNQPVKQLILGVQDNYGKSGNYNFMLKKNKLGCDDIAKSVIENYV